MGLLNRVSGKYVNTGILIIRVGIGLLMFFHGLPKMTGGPEKWEKLGGAMGNLGIDFAPAFWGFMAAFAETIGGILLILGLFFTPAAGLIAITMLVAFYHHFAGGDPFTSYSNALKGLTAAAGLIFTGPGKYSLDFLFFQSKQDHDV